MVSGWALSTRLHGVSHCGPKYSSTQMSQTASTGLESDGSSSKRVVHLVSPMQFSISSHSIG